MQYFVYTTLGGSKRRLEKVQRWFVPYPFIDGLPPFWIISGKWMKLLFFSLGAARSPQIPPHYIAHWPFQSFNPKLDTGAKKRQCYSSTKDTINRPGFNKKKTCHLIINYPRLLNRIGKSSVEKLCNRKEISIFLFFFWFIMF